MRQYTVTVQVLITETRQVEVMAEDEHQARDFGVMQANDKHSKIVGRKTAQARCSGIVHGWQQSLFA